MTCIDFKMYPNFRVVQMPEEVCLRTDETLCEAPRVLQSLKSYSLTGGKAYCAHMHTHACTGMLTHMRTQACAHMHTQACAHTHKNLEAMLHQLWKELKGFQCFQSWDWKWSSSVGPGGTDWTSVIQVGLGYGAATERRGGLQTQVFESRCVKHRQVPTMEK